MSFILEALKKSEEERRRQNIPDVQTIYSPAPPNRGSRTLKWVLLGALFLNAALMIWWIRPWESSEEQPGDKPVVVSSDSPQSLDSQVHAARPTPEADSGVEVKTVNYDRPKTPEAKSENPPRQAEAVPAVGAETETTLQKAGQAAPAVLRIEDLPESLRKELPEDLRISLHFYTLDTASRMARINGKNLREGQEVIPGCRLEEITPGGVILNYRQTRFSIGDY